MKIKSGVRVHGVHVHLAQCLGVVGEKNNKVLLLIPTYSTCTANIAKLLVYEKYNFFLNFLAFYFNGNNIIIAELFHPLLQRADIFFLVSVANDLRYIS